MFVNKAESLHIQLFIPVGERDRVIPRIVNALRANVLLESLTITVGGLHELDLRNTEIMSIADDAFDDDVECITALTSMQDRAKYFAKIASECDAIAVAYVPSAITTLMMDEFVRNCTQPVAIGAFQPRYVNLLKG